jgi:hypothetical protein
VTRGRRAARVWGAWCVELLNLDGRPRLWVNDGRYLAGYRKTTDDALDVLTRAGVPVDQRTRDGAGEEDQGGDPERE